MGFWRLGFLNEKAALMNDFYCEMAKCKESKFGSFRQLECVFYGLESRTEQEVAQAEDEQLRKVDNVKSEVNDNVAMRHATMQHII